MQLAGIVIQLMIWLNVSMKRLEGFLLADERTDLAADTTGHPNAAVPHALVLDDAAAPRYLRYTDAHSGIPGAADGVMVRLHDVAFRWREGKAAKTEKRDAVKDELVVVKKTLGKSREVVGEQAWESAGQKNANLTSQLEALDAAIELCGSGTLLPSSGKPTLFVPHLEVQRGSMTCIVGAVGVGKSTLLAGMLRETDIEAGSVELAGRVAYCAQEPFILHGSVIERPVTSSLGLWHYMAYSMGLWPITWGYGIT